MTLNLLTTTDKNFPILQASKWLQIQILIEKEEFENLFNLLGEIYFFKNGVILEQNKAEISKKDFLLDYEEYLKQLKEKTIPDLAELKKKFTLILTTDRNCIFAFKISENEVIIKAKDPIIQIQSHSMYYSPEDNKFRPMVFGKESITWGIQFSFPQIYLDAKSLEIKNALTTDTNLNSDLFKKIQKWIRIHTFPTTFESPVGRLNTSFRIGKQCLPWIENHIQLLQKGLKVIHES